MQHGVDIESYYDLRLLSEVSVSPDGERVAFTARESDPAADEHRTGLYVAPTDGSREPHRLTRASTASAPTWGPDGDTLAFLAARDTDLDRTRGRVDEGDDETDEAEADEDGEDDGSGSNGGNGDEKPTQQVWAFDLARGGDARQLTAFERGVTEFDLAPDGGRLVVAARDPTDEEEDYLDRREDDGPIEVTRLQHKRDGAGWLDDVTTYLFVGDLDSEAADAESFDRLDDAYGAGSAEPLAGLQPAWGPTDRIAFTTCVADDPDDSGAYDVCTIAPDGSECRVVTDGSLRCASPTWSPDGDRLAFDGSNYDNWYEPNEAYVAPDEADAAFESVSQELDRTLARSGAPRWLDDETLVVPIADEAWTRLAVCPVDGEPRRAFTRQGRDRTIAAFDLAGDTVALGLTGADQPPDVYAVPGAELREDDAGGPTKRVSALNDEWLDERVPDGELDEYGHGLGPNAWDARPFHLDESLHPTTWTTNRALEFLDSRDPERPFFLNVSYLKPHTPLDPPRPYWELYAERDLPPAAVGDWVEDAHGASLPVYPPNDAWRGELPPDVVERARRGYYGLLTQIDRQLSRLIRELRAQGEWENTVVVFTSDHGDMLGDHHLWRKCYGYEPSARVPFVVKPPGSVDVNRGRIVDRPVGLEDVVPTLLSACGVPIPDTVEGNSVLRLLDDPETDDWREYYHGEHGPIYEPENATQYLVGERFKLVWNPVTGTELLFDLRADPLEEHDLSDDPDYADVLDDLRDRLVDRLRGREEGFTDGGELTPTDLEFAAGHYTGYDPG